MRFRRVALRGIDVNEVREFINESEFGREKVGFFRDERSFGVRDVVIGMRLRKIGLMIMTHKGGKARIISGRLFVL